MTGKLKKWENRTYTSDIKTLWKQEVNSLYVSVQKVNMRDQYEWSLDIFANLWYIITSTFKITHLKENFWKPELFFFFWKQEKNC